MDVQQNNTPLNSFHQYFQHIKLRSYDDSIDVPAGNTPKSSTDLERIKQIRVASGDTSFQLSKEEKRLLIEQKAQRLLKNIQQKNVEEQNSAPVENNSVPDVLQTKNQKKCIKAILEKVFPAISGDNTSRSLDKETNDWLTEESIGDVLSSARADWREGKFQLALQTLEKASTLISKSIVRQRSDLFQILCNGVYVLQAECFVALCKFDMANESLEKFVALNDCEHSEEIQTELQARYFRCRAEINFRNGLYQTADQLAMEGLEVISSWKKGTAVRIILAQISLLLLLSKIFLRAGNYSSVDRVLKQAKESSMFVMTQSCPDLSIVAEVMVGQAAFLRVKGNNRSATRALEQALKVRQTLFGNSHPKIASCLQQLAALALERCEYSQAEENINACLAMRREYFEDVHPAVASIQMLQAKYFHAVGKFERSHSIIGLVLDRLLKIFPRNHPDVADAIWIQGEIKRSTGLPVAAENFFKEVLSIRRECFQTDVHLEVVHCLYSLGLNAVTQGQFAYSTTALERCFQIQTQIMKTLDVTDNVEIELTKVWLSLSYALQGKFEEAQAILTPAGKKVCATLGTNHALSADTLVILGQVCTMRGKYSDANILFSKAIATKLKILGPQHPDVAVIETISGNNMRIPGDYDAAKELSHSALKRLRQLHLENSMFMATALYNHANLLRDTSNYEESESLYQQALQLTKDNIGDSNAYFAEILGDAGECFRLQHNTEAATSVLNAAVELRKRMFGASHVQVAEANLFLALLHMDTATKSSYQDALFLLNESVLPEMIEHLDDWHPMIMYVKANIGSCMKSLFLLQEKEAKEAATKVEVSDNKEEAEAEAEVDADRTTAVSTQAAVDLPGQSLIDDALGFFESYPQIVFSKEHPWVKRFGGFGEEVSIDEGVAEAAHPVIVANVLKKPNLNILTEL